MWLLSLVPARWAQSVARPLAWVAWRVSPRLRTVSLKNLELCYPDLDDAPREALARESMRHYVRNGLDTGISWYGSRQRIERLFEDPVGAELLDEAIARGQGVVLLAPHFGSWELLGLRITEQKTVDGAILYKPGDDPDLMALLIRKRERFGATLLPANRRGLKKLLAHLRAGKVVGVLPDQEPTDGDGRFAPFFGVPALTGVLVPRLLRRTGATALFCAAVREPAGRYRMHYIPGESALYGEDIDQALAALNRGVEAVIALDPAQYLWGYKRLRARPEGQPRFY